MRKTMDIKIKTTKQEIYITKDGKEFDDPEVAHVWQRHLVMKEKFEQNSIEDFCKQIDDFKNFVVFYKNT
jgi:hypothetical protein